MIPPPEPEVKVEPKSPFIRAALEGDVSLVRSLLKGFPGSIDVNHTAAIYPPPNERKANRRIIPRSHNSTALLAAVYNGHLEVARELLILGASVNLPNCRNSTPLHEATVRNNLGMVKVLHQHGAHIDVVNGNGLSPLGIALASNNTDIVRYLLEAGASMLAPNPTGFSAVHVAAASGHLEGIDLLLSCRASPMFSEPSPSSEGYIPCPLYIAAVCGHRDVVAVLANHPECPPACRADALLLLGSKEISFVLNEKQDKIQLEEAKKLWEQALKIREEYQLAPKFLPPMPAYNNAVEIQTLDDLKQLFDSGSNEAVPFQCLIIRERCMGFMCIPKYIVGENQTEWDIVHDLMTACKNTTPKDDLVLKLLESLKNITTHPSNYSAHACETLSDQVLNFIAQFEEAMQEARQCIQQILKRGGSPQFENLIPLMMTILERVHMLISTEAPCAIDAIQTMLRYYPRLQIGYPAILVSFILWLRHSSKTTIKEQYIDVVGSDACEACGRAFVARHLDTPSMSERTLLHYAFNHKFRKKISFDNQMEIPMLITALLRWGADAAIDVSDSKHQRPIHLAARLGHPMIITCFLNHNAHLDAVNAEGKAYYQITNVVKNQNPLPLMCQASRRVVAERIPYKMLDLPRRIKEFISFHDPKH